MLPRVFFFLRKSSCSALRLHRRMPVFSNSPPLRLHRGLSVSGPKMAELSALPSSSQGLRCVYHTLSLFPSLQPQATESLSVLLKPSLAGEGAVNPALSQESCSRPSGPRPGAAVALVPHWSQGPFCPEAIPLPFVFSVSSILFGLLSP